jgi:RNA polymerase sigma-70 factor (ECF subfamily)
MSLDHEFNKIYDEYYPIILHYVIKIAGTTDAEDIAQDIFKKIYKGLEGFEQHSKLSTWIYRIATNVDLRYVVS